MLCSDILAYYLAAFIKERANHIFALFFIIWLNQTFLAIKI